MNKPPLTPLQRAAYTALKHLGDASVGDISQHISKMDNSTRPAVVALLSLGFIHETGIRPTGRKPAVLYSIGPKDPLQIEAEYLERLRKHSLSHKDSRRVIARARDIGGLFGSLIAQVEHRSNA